MHHYVTVVVQNYLWFKIFQTSLIFISIVSNYDNEFETMKNNNQTGLKNFKPKINLNHNTHIPRENKGPLIFS